MTTSPSREWGRQREGGCEGGRDLDWEGGEEEVVYALVSLCVECSVCVWLMWDNGSNVCFNVQSQVVGSAAVF